MARILFLLLLVLLFCETAANRIDKHDIENITKVKHTQIVPHKRISNIKVNTEFVHQSIKSTRVRRSPNLETHNLRLIVSTYDILFKVFNPNYKWETLYDLQFDNQLGQICKINGNSPVGIGMQPMSRNILPSIKILTLTNFTNCEMLFDYVINSLQMSNLEILKLSGQVNDVFIQQIQEVLRKYNSSLKSIYLSGVLFSRTNIFEIRTTYTLKNVDSIYLKLKLEGNKTVAGTIINDRFCSIFPNIVKLGIKQAAIGLSQILKLRTCKKLKYLKVIINLTSEETASILAINWHLQFSSLENIAIKLVFDECPSVKNFEKLIGKLQHFSKYILCSNCVVSTRNYMKCTQGS